MTGATSGRSKLVGFIGLGVMGGPMADHVIRAGHQTRLFDVDSARVRAHAGPGAVAAASAVDAARGAEVVCVVVHDDAQVLAVVDAELLAAMADGGVVVVHSTVMPATVRILEERAAELGRHVVDMGISGGPKGAAAGSLVLLAGGERQVVARVETVVSTYGRGLERCGALGAGMAAKAARNLIALGVMALAADALDLAVAGGVERGTFSRIVARTDPCGHCQRLLDGTLDIETGASGRDVGTTGLKDLEVVLSMARDMGSAAPMATAAIADWPGVLAALADHGASGQPPHTANDC